MLVRDELFQCFRPHQRKPIWLRRFASDDVEYDLLQRRQIIIYSRKSFERPVTHRPRLRQDHKTMRLKVNVSSRKHALLNSIGNDLFDKTLDPFLALENAATLSHSQRLEFLKP